VPTAIELEADLWSDHAEDRRGAAELLAALADYDPALLRRALLGEWRRARRAVICSPTRSNAPRTRRLAGKRDSPTARWAP